MYKTVMDVYKQCDVVIMSAAVADYTPNEVAEQKIKKKTNTFEIALKPTIDILAELGSNKQPQQTLIGFALETENELENAQGKLQRKNLDYIVLNSLNNAGAGFKHNTNRITIIDKDNKITHFELKSKAEAAKDIIETCLI
jgi:phosphopantothenoylcysteine decarboxylase/phosphopantothenate--cysteine ligase